MACWLNLISVLLIVKT